MSALPHRRPTDDRGNSLGDHGDVIESLTALITLYLELTARWMLLGHPEDMENIIRYQRYALMMVPEVDPIGLRSMLFKDLGRSYMLRFERLGEISDLNKAIDHQHQAVVITPDNCLRKRGFLARLGDLYRRRFKRIGKVADIDKAIYYGRQAMLLTCDGHEDKPGLLNDLGVSYRCRFDRLGDLSDLDKAIKSQSQALQLIPDDHKTKPSIFTNLGNSHMQRSEYLGELEDLDKSINCHSQAVLLTPAGHTNQPALLNNLGNSHRYRYRRHGDLVDIDKAIDYQNRAVFLTPDSDASKPGRLSNLGSSYLNRYERHREVSDMDHAVKCHLQAVQLTPDDHPDKPLRLHSLGNSFLSRFEIHREPAVITNAINAYAAAVLLVPADHTAKPALLAGLGNSYLARFQSDGKPIDIDNAIKYYTQSGRPGMLSHLGRAFLVRFQRIGEIADIDLSIKYLEESMTFTGEGIPGTLAEAYWTRFKSGGGISDVERACMFYQQAAQTETISPALRIKWAKRWAQCSTLLGVSPRLAYHMIMESVPQLSWLGITIVDRVASMGVIEDAAVAAAAWAVSVKAYDLAVEWIEEGRSVVWRQLLQLRKRFDDLSAVDPALSERLKAVAFELEQAGARETDMSLVNNLPDPESEEAFQHHHRLAAEWDQLIERARLLPGFSDFMRPQKVNQLIRAAKEGPVVIINVHSSRCDALIALPNSDKIAHVPLDKFSPEKATRAHEQLSSLVGHRGARARGFKRKSEKFICKEILSSLWSDVVKPILDFLGYTRKLPVVELPRVTWCTTGPLSFLPLHAAGRYDGSQPNAFDLVISSYAPNLSSLLATNPLVEDQDSGVLAVGQMSNKGLGDLPNTVKELELIQTHAKGIRCLQLDGNNATVGAVLKGMKECSWVHLACHASQHPVYPTESAFHLRDGDLSLLTIAKQSLKNKGLAFLSACQTAMGDKVIPDEAAHLAAGMLMVGYPSVIATMWGIADVDAPEIAHHVYAELLKDKKMDYTRAARALHGAVAGLREKVGQDSFDRWVPFVHIGI